MSLFFFKQEREFPMFFFFSQHQLSIFPSLQTIFNLNLLLGFWKKNQEFERTKNI